MIHTGDCIEVMRGMPEASVDAVVTDPPYGLGFMGKAWDTAGQRASIPPSVAVRIEDGRDVGRLGNYPGGKGQAAVRFDAQPFQAWCEAWGREALRVTKPGGYLLAFGGTRTHHRLVCGLEDAGWIIRDELDWIYASGFPKGRANLKPAHEPIVLARKPGPLRPLNIEETRIGTFAEGEYPTRTTKIGGSNNNQANARGPDGKPIYYDLGPPPSGRWPSNLLLSSPELFDEPNPWVVGSGATTGPGTWTEASSIYGTAMEREPGGGRRGEDSGGYSRFFVIPKSDRRDREPIGYNGEARLNVHPTCKPTDLMRHLIRLVTPSGGTILDPFLGSGSTAIAAELEGFPWIGIEKEPEYVAIAEARLNGTQRGLGLDTPLVGSPRKPSKGRWTDPEIGSPSYGDTGFKKGKRNWRVRQAAPDEEPAA